MRKMLKSMDPLSKTIFWLSTIIILLGVIPPWNILAISLLWFGNYVVYKKRRV